MDGGCDCGAVTVSVPAPPPEINACRCAWCTRIGGRWGYYDVAAVSVSGPLDSYRRADRVLDFNRCRTCGVLVEWREPGGTRMGVNMANFSAADLAGVPVVAHD